MMTRSSSSSSSFSVAAEPATIDIAASAKRMDVNNRIPLRYYFRIADNVLKQADIFRVENDIIDLYVMLLRFSSLVTETIPRHRDYRSALQTEKNNLKKKLLNALSELEKLQPIVQRRIEDSNRKRSHPSNNLGYQPQDQQLVPSNMYPPTKPQISLSNAVAQLPSYVAQQYNSQALRTQQLPFTRPLEEQFLQISLNMPRPKEETLARHSIFGPNGLQGKWQPPPSDKGVRYPTTIDLSPVVIPSARDTGAQKPSEENNLVKRGGQNLESKVPEVEPFEPACANNKTDRVQELVSLISFETIEAPVQTAIIRQPSPPPVLAEVQDLIPSPAAEGELVLDSSSPESLRCGETPLELHISTALMDSFMRMAKSNTDKNLETCGVLAGSLKNRMFSVTALIIPKQESTSDSCSTTNEEEIFDVQDKQSLFPLGWIHTHPTQSCFMSSIDVHTQYSYQIMLPEAIAIVMAPKDSSRTHGMFRLTTPGGMNVIRQCPKRGFHAHDPPSDGSPIYKQCTDVYMNPKLKFDVIDLR